MAARICLLALLLPIGVIYAQRTLPDSLQQSDRIMNLSGDGNEQTLLDLIEELLFNPLDINTVSEDDLNQLPDAEPITVKKIIEYRTKYGAFFSPNDMYNVRGVDSVFIQKLMPFLKFPRGGRKMGEKEKMGAHFKFRTSFRQSSSIDIINGNFREGLWANKLLIQAEGVTLRATGTKYVGDARIFPNVPFAINYTNRSISLTIGDYEIKSGMGLISGRSLSGQFGANAMAQNGNNGISVGFPVTYNNSRTLRGSAILFNYNKLSFGASYSGRRLPYRLDSDAPDGITPLKTISYATSPPNKSLYERAINLFTKFEISSYLTANLLGSRNLLEKPEFAAADFAERRGAWSATLSYSAPNLFAGIEFARATYGNAFIARITSENRSYGTISSAIRYLGKGFNCFRSGIRLQYNNAWGNEAGLTLQFSRSTPTFTALVFTDLFFTPVTGGVLPIKKKGFECRIQPAYHLNETSTVTAEFKYRKREGPFDLNSWDLEPETISRYMGLRLETRFKGSIFLTTKGGIKQADDKGTRQSGAMLEQGIKWYPTEHFSVGGNLALYRTPGSSVTFYPANSFLSGSVSTYSLNGDGLSWTLWLGYGSGGNNSVSIYFSSFEPADQLDAPRSVPGKHYFGLQAEAGF